MGSTSRRGRSGAVGQGNCLEWTFMVGCSAAIYNAPGRPAKAYIVLAFQVTGCGCGNFQLPFKISARGR
jgi:hypothetical protein